MVTSPYDGALLTEVQKGTGGSEYDGQLQTEAQKDVGGLTQVGRTWNIRHDVSEEVGQTWNIRHDISAFISQTFNIRHDIGEFIGRVWNIRHDIGELIGEVWNIRHDIFEAVYHLAGVTRDEAGDPLANVRVVLFKRTDVAEGSRVYTIIEHQNSDGSGDYDFNPVADNESLYMIMAINQGSPIVRGVTNDNLTPVEV